MTFPPVGTNPTAQPAPPIEPKMLTGADLNMRIKHGDPNFPNELWGRTVGDAMRYYSVMREDFKTRNMRQPAPQPTPAAPAPPTSEAPATRGYVPPAPAPAAPSGPAFDEERLVSLIRSTMRAELGQSPIAMAAADTVKVGMRSKYPDFAHYEQSVLEELRGADANILADPATWETAYFFVKGRAHATGQGLPTAPVGSPGPVHGSRGELVTPPVAAPGMPPYFAESPSAPPPTAHGMAADPRLDPQNILMARRHGIPIDEYVQWLNGNVPSMGGGA